MKYTEDQINEITKAAKRLSADNIAAHAPRTTTPMLEIEIAGREHSMEVESHQDAEALVLVINAGIDMLTEVRDEITELQAKKYQECEEKHAFEPVDANGQILEEGDLITFKSHPGEFAIVESVDDAPGIIRGLTANAPAMPMLKDAIKLEALDLDDYIKLARRTLDPEMTEKETLGDLRDGILGEWGEVRKAVKICDKEKILKECGDLMWYASILLDVRKDGPYRTVYLHNKTFEAVLDLIERTKKEIYHEVDPGWLHGLADGALTFAEATIQEHGGEIGEVRYQNIRKLLERYPDGFVKGGGER